MAIKKRLLHALSSIDDAVLHIAAIGSMSQMKPTLHLLDKAEQLSQVGLSSTRYAEYEEIYTGLKLAWRQLSIEMSKSEKEELLTLCHELLSHLIKTIQKENAFKKEIFFLPYKASMWDSLESVWRAADEDKEHCIAYVMPIPYADLTSEHTVAEWHCERGLFPKDVPTVDWESVDLAEICPDVIFIHNPYDQYNAVTSVDSRYYSYNLKKYTKTLVYIPYYATAGGMADGQSLCSAYLHADYIVIQAEKYRKFFDASLPDEKFLSLGSPKFDKVIRLCQNPPEPPAEWKEKLKGRKVFFYNTSLNGVLDCVSIFFRKMRYVFEIFKGRNDVCLLWRPHPLMEATLKSMRPEFIPEFEKLRGDFLSQDIGIYDGTEDIESTIALCDAYIGDGGTSVTSLFGMAGKPVFYLNNLIHHLPQKDDWLGHVNRVWPFLPQGWMIAYGNQLWHASGDDLHFKHCCDLMEYGGGGFYSSLLAMEGKLYVCPQNAQDIVVVEDNQIVRRIPLERRIERAEAFAGATYLYQEDEDYFFLLPVRYPAVVRYDFRHDRLDYVECPNDLFVREVNNERWRGAVFHWKDWLIFSSPIDAKGFAVNRHTLETREMTICHPDFGGSMFPMCRQWGADDYFFFPYDGRKVTRWNVRTGAVQEYDFPEGFRCKHPTRGYECNTRPFANGIFQDVHTILLAPLWGNMFVKLHIDTGIMEEWKTPFKVTPEGKNEYFFAGATGFFITEPDLVTWLPKSYQFYYSPERKRYHFDPGTEKFTLLEQDAVIDEAEMRRHVPGFCQMSEYDAYGCWEDAFNSLKDFIDGNISGAQFDKERQLAAYGKIAANADGTAGEKIYRFIKEKLAMTEG